MGKKDSRKRNNQAKQQQQQHQQQQQAGGAGDQWLGVDTGQLDSSRSHTPSATSDTSSMAEQQDTGKEQGQSADPDPFVIDDEQKPQEAIGEAAGGEPSVVEADQKQTGSSDASKDADVGAEDARPWADAGVGTSTSGSHHTVMGNGPSDGQRSDAISGDSDMTSKDVGTETAAARVRSTSKSSNTQMSERGAQTNPMQHSAFVDSSAAQDLGPDPIKIVDAQKTSDGVGQSPYIAYLIECNTLSAKRRYSEFASLRDALVTLHPTLIIPPIPSKHSLSDYYARQAKAKEDASIVSRRKRMLQVFLNRIKDHEKLSRSHVFRRFLDGRWSWHEITSSPPLSTLPKSNLRAPAADPSSPHASPAYLALPLPPSSAAMPLKHPNNRFLDSEAFTERFRNHLQGSLEKANRRAAKRWTEASNDYAELGAVLNEFSLGESRALANAIERTGQAADQTFMAIGKMLGEWETHFTEPLSEYSQYATVLQKLLKWRHLKHLQFEMAQDALEAKRVQLEELERVEAEAQRLNAALTSGGRGLVPSSSTLSRQAGSQAGQTREGVWDSVNNRGNSMRKSVYGSAAENEGPSSRAGPKNAAQIAANASPRPHSERLADSEEWTEPSLTDSAGSSRPTSPKTAANGGDGLTPEQRAATGRMAGASGRAAGARNLSGRSGGGGGAGGLLGALSNTLHSVMDVDPETTRRNTISRLKDSCAQLDEALELTERDLRYATMAIQADLDRFQRQKIRDVRDMVLAYARFHREYCAASLASWTDAKQEVDAITDQTPLPESNLARAQRRSDSDAGAAGSSTGANASSNSTAR